MSYRGIPSQMPAGADARSPITLIGNESREQRNENTKYDIGAGRRSETLMQAGKYRRQQTISCSWNKTPSIAPADLQE